MDAVIALFDEVSDFVCFADAAGKVVFLNKAGRRLVGIGANEDVTERGWLDFLPENERAHLQDEALPSVQREGAWRGRSALAAANGRTVPVTVSLVPRPGTDGSPAGLLVTMARIEDVLTRSRLERLLTASRVVLYSASTRDWTVSYLSANVETQFGYAAESFLRDPSFWPDRIHPEDAPTVLADMSGNTEKHQVHEYRFLHADGTYRWVLDETAIVKDENGDATELIGVWQDITERKEAERLLQEQAAAMMQFSTPLVPISDDVLVMPIVGALDAQRAEQVMTTLLDGVGKGQARVAILDITGVSVVDTQVADALLRAAKAVALLGAQVVITGIRSEVAQTLVQLGANMGDVVTRATLQAGVAFAMQGRAAGARRVLA